MKKAIFFFTFFFAVGLVSADAQSCSGAAAANKSCCMNKAAKAAAADASIEKRQAEDGTVVYVRRESDAQGNVRFVSVQYDEAANAFVNIAPKNAAAPQTEGVVKKSCSAAEMKSCSGAEKKACAGSGAGKACCAKPSEKKAEQ